MTSPERSAGLRPTDEELAAYESGYRNGYRDALDAAQKSVEREQASALAGPRRTSITAQNIAAGMDIALAVIDKVPLP